MTVGFLQFFTTFIIIGWVWSIYWGYLFIKKAFNLGGTKAPVAGPARVGGPGGGRGG